MELINILLENIERAPNDDLRESTYRALGYVCEEVPSYLSDFRIAILDKISKGMSKDQSDTAVKLSATDALHNALHFAEECFKIEPQRKMIMTMVFDSATCTDENVRSSAYQCLIQIGELYYEYLETHIVDIFKLTHSAIQSDDDSVKLRAIEF